MEQLKPILKYHFWILCGVVVLVAIGGGFWAMTGQADTIGSQVSKINGAKSKASSVMSVNADVGEEATVSVHPNDDTKAGMEEEIKDGKAEVMAAWQKLYDEQKDLLGWPMNALSADIAKSFDAFKPERMAFEIGNEDLEAPPNRRKQVQQVLARVLPKLADQIRAEWKVELKELENVDDSATPTSIAESPMDSLMMGQPLTQWSEADQEQWALELTQFRERNGNKDATGTPTTMQVLYAKENLVLLNGVLEIVKSANSDATTPGQALVKNIQSILIGNQALTAERLDLGSLSGGGGGPAGGMGDRMKAMRDYANNMGMSGDAASQTVTADELETMDPAHLRYVNEKFEPIPAKQYRTAAGANQLSDNSWMSVVRRVPVRLTLMIDETRIDDLLEECANAKIPLEVRQVTIIGGELPEKKAQGTKTSQAGANRQADLTAAGSGAGGASMTLEAGGSGGNTATLGDSGLDSKNYKTAEFNSHFNVPVEIFGVMKIYNEPEPEAIGLTPDTTATE